MRVNGRCQRRGHGCIEERRREGEKRNEAWRSLSPMEQLRQLDKRLGHGLGASKQREKLGD